MKKQLNVVKIGGNIIDDDLNLFVFLSLFADLKGAKILIHGGGKIATDLAAKLDVPQVMIEGRRYTDGNTLKIVTMVYAGLINKTIVARLQFLECNSLGLTGVDANLVEAHKRPRKPLDYGYVAEIDKINISVITSLLAQGLTPIIAPITHDGNGQLLNVNADTMAQEIAVSLAKMYDVQLIYSFEKEGVLIDINDKNSVIRSLNPPYYKQLKQQNKIFDGMIPKLDNAFKAIEQGIKAVIIGNAKKLDQLIKGQSGTKIEK